jgi:predicted alpha/beta superfamily hydrolase
LGASLLASLLLSSCPFPGPPTEGTTTEFELGSSYGTEYSIRVWVPSGLDPAAKVRTLYVLDGDETFNSAARLASERIGSGADPFIVVGIGYGSGANERERDYTPTVSEGSGGGCDAFLGFVADSLVPRIESSYPALADRGARALNGHSFGGLAVLEALFTRSDRFSLFVATSPSLWWDGSVMFDRLSSYLASSGTAQASRLYLSVGSHEGGGMDALFLAFADRIAEASPPTLAFEREILENKRHWDNRYLALGNALPFILEGSP